MIANLQFWYWYCTGISICVVSVKFIPVYLLHHKMFREILMKTQLHCRNSYRTCCLCGAAISVPTVTKWSGANSGVGNLFQQGFWWIPYNFSIISNLFDNNNSYALYQYTEIENVQKNCIIFYLVKTSKLRAKNLKKCLFHRKFWLPKFEKSQLRNHFRFLQCDSHSRGTVRGCFRFRKPWFSNFGNWNFQWNRRFQNSNAICLKTCSRSTKMAITDHRMQIFKNLLEEHALGPP